MTLTRDLYQEWIYGGPCPCWWSDDAFLHDGHEGHCCFRGPQPENLADHCHHMEGVCQCHLCQPDRHQKHLNELLKEDTDSLRGYRDLFAVFDAGGHFEDGGVKARASIEAINAELDRRKAPRELHPERKEADRERLRQWGFDPQWSRLRAR
jgi:hypothetical protein